MVGGTVACRRRGHVAEHRVGASPDGAAHPVEHRRIGHVTDKDLDPVENVGLQKVDSDKLRAAAAQLCTVGHHLKPASRRAAEIDDRHAGLQKPVPFIDLFKLQRGTRAEAARFRLRHERVVQLPGQPALRRRLATPHLLRLTGQAGVVPVASPGRPPRRRSSCRFPRHVPFPLRRAAPPKSLHHNSLRDTTDARIFTLRRPARHRARRRGTP